MRFKATLVLMLCAVTAAQGDAAIWHVDSAAPAGGDGRAWSSAFRRVQAGIDAAHADGGGEVWVAAGVFVEAGADPLSGALLVRDGVQVLGGFSGGETLPSQRPTDSMTQIKVEQVPDVLNVVELGNSTLLNRIHVAGAIVAGVYCEGKLNVTLHDVRLTGEDAPQDGTGVPCGLFVLDSNEVVLTGCSIVSGGRFAAAMFARSNDIVIDDCEISENHGGIAVRSVKNLSISGCIFRGNTGRDQWAGALSLYGGYTSNKEYIQNVEVSRCSFLDNFSDTFVGAGIDGRTALSVKIHDSRFIRNKTTKYSTPAIVIGWDTESLDVDGGCSELAPQVDHCLFIENETQTPYGGAVSMPGINYYEKSELTLRGESKIYGPCSLGDNSEYFPTFISNSTFVRNKSVGKGSAVYMDGLGGEPPVKDCIFWENDVPAVVPASSSEFGWSAVVRSRVQEPHWGADNYFDDPMFVDSENGDFRLGAGSPCIDYVPFYGGTDIDGVPRGLDGDGDGVLGQDTGAYEYVPPFHADQDGNMTLSLWEVLRIIQFYNSDEIHCDSGTEDGFSPGPGETGCSAHASDYSPHDWSISLDELLRSIQIYNSGGFAPCLIGEDGVCLGE